MSDYLAILAAKAVNAFTPPIQPRLPSRFESEGGSFINPGPFNAEPSGEKAAPTDGVAGRPLDFESEAPLARPASEIVPAEPREVLGEAANLPPPFERTDTVLERRIEPRKRTPLARPPRSSMDGSDSEHSFDLDADKEDPLSKLPSNLQLETRFKPQTGPGSNSKPPGGREAVPRQETLISETKPPTARPLRTGRKTVSTSPAEEAMPDDIAIAQVLGVSVRPGPADGVSVDHQQSPGCAESTTAAESLEQTPSDAGISSRLISAARPSAFEAAQDRVISRESPTIRVTIGRVEVRAVMQQPSPPPQVKRPSHRPALSLEEYLKQRSAGKR